ncbi:MAG TPA: preprotein translocase subunit YajC [Acidimicrobiia bacterium]
MYVILAQTDAPAGSGASSLIFLAVMFAIFYFLFIRPQRKRARQQQELQSEISVGDQVQTIGGIHGRVVSADDDTLVIDIESGRMRIARRAVSGRIGTDGS